MYIWLTYGATRFVLLLGPVVIKIPRIRLSMLISRLFHHLRNGTVRATMKKHEGKLLSIAAQGPLWGIRSSRGEYRFYAEHPDLPIAPIYWAPLGGFIIVQARGRPATSAELRRWLPCRLKSRGFMVNMELVRTEHVCMIGAKPCLIDYGNEDSRDQMMRFFA